MVNKKRLITPTDDLESIFPGYNFQNRRSFVTSGEKVLLVDPCYVADVYNSTDEAACYVREHGLILMDFGGDTSVPVWWEPPFLVMPISAHRSDGDLKPPPGTTVLAATIGCDSGSFVFLPHAATIPHIVRRKVKEALEAQNAVALQLPAGQWTAYYEQFDSPQDNMRGLYRDIVLKHSRTLTPAA